MSAAGPDRSPEAARIDEDAARWFVRRDAGLDPAERREFEAWLAADPRHAARFARHEATWSRFAALEEVSGTSAPGGAPVLRPPPAAWRRRLLAAGSVAAVLAVGVIGWMLRKERGEVVATVEAHEFRAAAYQNGILPDGSILELNTGGGVRIVFNERERTVWMLSGEAHFHVVSDPRRPFVVHAGGAVVRAVGTAFNVRLTESAVEVLVTEGVVRLHPARPAAAGGGGREMVERQRSIVAFEGAGAGEPEVVDTLSAAQLEELLAWKPATLEFSGAPLEAVVTAFNKRNRVRLVLADAALGRLPIDLTFRSDDVGAFVRMLEITFNIRSEPRGAEEIVLHPSR